MEDNITFLYRPFHLPHGEHVTLTVEAELTSVEAFHSVVPAMAGLMIMEGEKPGGKRLLTFLAMGSDLLQYMLSRVEPGLQANNLVYPGAVPEGGPYPIRLRLQLRGRYVIAAYRTAATEEWIPLAPEATWNLPAQGDHVCCGLFVNTGIIGTEARAVFKNLRMYTEELPHETLQALPPEQKREPPLLFREDYRSGALHVDPEDPMAWTDVDQYANLCTLPEGENLQRSVTIRYNRMEDGFSILLRGDDLQEKNWNDITLQNNQFLGETSHLEISLPSTAEGVYCEEAKG